MKLNFKDRQALWDQLEAITDLKAALWAFRLVDRSLQITISPDWMDGANTIDIIADISSVLGGFVEPDDHGVLKSTLFP